MTTELEKQFFDTFGIEPIAEYCKHQCNNELDESACIGCKYIEKVEYPQISDKQYLELICCFHNNNSICHSGYNFTDIYTLKTHLLKTFVQIMNNDIKDERKDNLKHQVQAIFERER